MIRLEHASMDYRCTACTRVTGQVADWYPLSFSFNFETST